MFDPAAVPCPADNGWPRTWGRQLSAEAFGAIGTTAIKSARIVAAPGSGRDTWASQTRYVGGGTEEITKWLNRCRGTQRHAIVSADECGHLVDYFQFSGDGWTDTSAVEVVHTVVKRG